MASAVGSYATLAGAKALLNITDTSSDALIQSLCDRANAWIESPAGTGRILAPITLLSTTLASAASAGATSISVTAATNARVGDEIVIGSLSGTHEGATIAAISGTTLTLQSHESASGLKNSYPTGAAVLGCYVYDGHDALEGGRALPLRIGLNGIAQLEVALVTPPNDTYHLVPASDYFLRPRVEDREPGWPATELWLTDVPTSGNPSPVFLPMMNNVRVIPAGSPGWPVIPDEIVKVAYAIVAGLYRTRASGDANTATLGDDGAMTINRLLSTDDWKVIHFYKRRLPVII
jgi:hypothetical protein